MTNILTFFSTRTLLQIVFVLGSAVASRKIGLFPTTRASSPHERSEMLGKPQPRMSLRSSGLRTAKR